MGGSLRRRAAGLFGIVIATAITAWAVRSDFGHSLEEHTGLNLLFQLRGFCEALQNTISRCATSRQVRKSPPIRIVAVK